MSAQQPASGLPILGALSPIGRFMLVATAVVSVAAIVVDVVFGPIRRCCSCSPRRQSSVWPGWSDFRPSGSARSRVRRSAASSTRRLATSPN